MANLFEDDRYYVFIHNNLSLNLGFSDSSTPGAATLLPLASYSTENWQIFYDDGVYFLRNYDWGDKWQLSLDSKDQTVPQMRASNVSLGNQWLFTAGSTSGTYLIRNALVNEGNVLAVATDNNGSTVPIMNTDQSQAAWTLSKNIGALSVTNTAMLATYTSIEAYSTKATASSSTASSTGVTSPSTQSASLSGGAIAGIVIGALAAIVALLLLVVLLLRRRRRAEPTNPHEKVDVHDGFADGTTDQLLMSELQDTERKPELYGSEQHIAELHHDPLKAELAVSEPISVAAELPGSEIHSQA